jgi:3-methylfumaryl-CoA hydratase
MVFVTVAHEIYAQGVLIVQEEQDIVYRGAAGARPAAAAVDRWSARTRAVVLDEAALFRFSALTFNAHRIHYDRPYAMTVEGYPGLVVQGPFIATLLMDHVLQKTSMSRVRGFSFRAQRPLFDGVEAHLCSDDEGEVWCKTAAGEITMNARVDLG